MQVNDVELISQCEFISWLIKRGYTPSDAGRITSSVYASSTYMTLFEIMYILVDIARQHG